MSIESVMPSSNLVLCCPLLLLPLIPPSIRVFSNESTLRMRWPKYWSFSFSIRTSKEHPGLISLRMDWLDLLAVQGTLQSLLQHHSSKASILQRSAFFTVQLSHPYLTTGKTLVNYKTQFKLCTRDYTMAPHSSTFAQKIPWMEEPGRLQSMGLLESDTTERLHFHFSLSCIGGERQPTPVFLPGESQGRGSLVSYHLWGRTESDTTEVTQQWQQGLYNNNVSSWRNLSFLKTF